MFDQQTFYRNKVYTVEVRIKESSFFLSSLDWFLFSRLVFSSPAFKILIRVLIYSTCLVWIDTVFSTRIPDDSLGHFIVKILV